uniref:ATP-dependent DNA helicase PIF1 n=1 Tax=Steinernema glaseri TaxID=37863 RepID=A0A1I7Z420_9BILA
MVADGVYTSKESCAPSPSTKAAHYCYQLECCVRLESNSSSNRCAPIESKESTVVVGRNFHRQIVLNVTLNKGRRTNNVSYLLHDCRIFGRNIKKGMGSIEVKNKSIVVYLTNCAPDQLNVFLKSLEAKLALMREALLKNLQNPIRTPVTTRSELLKGLPKVFHVLSPLSIAEIRQLQKLRGTEAGCQSPSGSRQPLQTLNGGSNALTPTSRPRKRPASTISNQSKESALGLSEEQKRIIRVVLREKQSLFFTGSAGTGKSLVLKKIIGSLPAASTFVTAATGVAACQIGGTTLHSFVGIGTGTASLSNCIRLVEEKKGLVAQWKSCTHLIIDEISMVSGDYFEKMEAVARTIRRSNLPFGGIQLIITGDFLQLPPVVQRSDEPKFCFQTAAWSRCVKRTVVLRKVHRQNDNRFVEILNQIRVGRCDDAATVDIQNTWKNRFEPDMGIVATKLCTHTKDADSVNQRNLEMLEGRTRHFIAQDESAIPDTLNKNVPRDLTLKVGAQVMLTKNVDLSKGMSNGSRGVIKTFSKDGYPIVQFLDKRAPKEGVEVKPYPFSVRIAGCDGLAVRRQIPLMLAWAISIHKSQGLTLDAVEVCLDRVFADGQAYVALSRARSLSSLCVLGFEARNVIANEAVVAYYESLTEDGDEYDCDSVEDSVICVKRPRALFSRLSTNM